MAEEIAFDNGKISNFQGLVTLTLILDRVILQLCMTHRPLPTCQISLKLKTLLWTDGKTYERMDGWTDGHLRPTLSGQLRRVNLKILSSSLRCQLLVTQADMCNRSKMVVCVTQLNDIPSYHLP